MTRYEVVVARGNDTFSVFVLFEPDPIGANGRLAELGPLSISEAQELGEMLRVAAMRAKSEELTENSKRELRSKWAELA